MAGKRTDDAQRSQKERTARMLRKDGGTERGPGERHTAAELEDLIEGGRGDDQGGGAATRDNDPRH
jgi:hypothetical protein